MSFQIRKANKSDAPAILELIKGLALYEKEPDAVESSVEDIVRDGFGSSPLFNVLLAETNDGEAVGFALFFYTWSTWKGRPSLFLEDLFVDPAHRGKGIGLALFKKVARTAVERKCQRMEWSVLDWNHLARDFYHSLGAFHNEGWLPYRLTGAALAKFGEDQP